MAFPQEYIDCGKITYTNCSVSVYKSMFDRTLIYNVPTNIKEAKWVGNNVHVILQDGWTRVYTDFMHCTTFK